MPLSPPSAHHSPNHPAFSQPQTLHASVPTSPSSSQNGHVASSSADASEPLLQPLLFPAIKNAPGMHIHTGRYVRPHMHGSPEGDGEDSSPQGRAGMHLPAPPFRTLWARTGVLYRELMMPCLLVSVGVGFSVAGLYVAVVDVINSMQQH